MYLLQLVQALKYEDYDEIQAAYEREKELAIPKPIDRRESTISTQSAENMDGERLV